MYSLHSHLALNFSIEQKEEHEEVNDEIAYGNQNAQSNVECSVEAQRTDDGEETDNNEQNHNDCKDDPENLVKCVFLSVVDSGCTPHNDKTENDADDSAANHAPVLVGSIPKVEYSADDCYKSYGFYIRCKRINFGRGSHSEFLAKLEVDYCADDGSDGRTDSACVEISADSVVQSEDCGNQVENCHYDECHTCVFRLIKE